MPQKWFLNYLRAKIIPVKNRDVQTGIKLGTQEVISYVVGRVSMNELRLLLPSLLANPQGLAVYQKIYGVIISEVRERIKETIGETASRVN